MATANYARLALLKAQLLNNDLRAAIAQAQNNNPGADMALKLADMDEDLASAGDALTARLNQVNNMPAPPPALDAGVVAQVKALMASVEQARLAGMTAAQVLDIAGQVFSMAMTIASL